MSTTMTAAEYRARLGPDLETVEQARLVAWTEGRDPEHGDPRTRHPELALLFAIPNGGIRHKATAGRLKAEGVKPGVPDLMLPVPRGGFHGLFVEMKRQGRQNRAHGDCSPEQCRWHERLRAMGYRVEVVYGADDARKIIEEYLEAFA